MTLKINETFVATQGEGIWLGTPSVFVRTHGCPLACAWCDTPQTSIDAATSPYQKMAESDLLAYLNHTIRTTNVRHIVLTGGEPLLQHKPLGAVVALLREDHDVWITMETSGAHYREDMDTLMRNIDLLSLSPKLHEKWDGVQRFVNHYASFVARAQVKVVVQDPEQAREAIKRSTPLLELFLIHSTDVCLILQPETGRGVGWAKELCELACDDKTFPPNVRVIPQTHRLIGVR